MRHEDRRQDVQLLFPHLDVYILEQHLSSLEEDYFASRDAATTARHLEHLSGLSAQNPVEVILTDLQNGGAECVVVAFNHPFEFSLIADVLARTGFQIETGEVFTLRPPARNGSRRARTGAARAVNLRVAWRTPRGVSRSRDPWRLSVFIDSFTGQITDTDADSQIWAGRFKASITETITLLDLGDKASVEKAKHRVNEM